MMTAITIQEHGASYWVGAVASRTAAMDVTRVAGRIVVGTTLGAACKAADSAAAASCAALSGVISSMRFRSAAGNPIRLPSACRHYPFPTRASIATFLTVPLLHGGVASGLGLDTGPAKLS